MNSGIHDIWNLINKLWTILRKDGSAELLDRFDRQHRTVTRNFIQAQTISNMQQMQSAADKSAERRLEIARIHANPTLRRDYLMRQSMFQSLEEAEQVA